MNQERSWDQKGTITARCMGLVKNRTLAGGLGGGEVSQERQNLITGDLRQLKILVYMGV